MDAKQQLEQAALEMAERNGIPEERREAFVADYIRLADQICADLRKVWDAIGVDVYELIVEHGGGKDEADG